MASTSPSPTTSSVASSVSSASSSSSSSSSSSGQPSARAQGKQRAKATKVEKSDLKLSEAYLLFKESIALQRIVLDAAGKDVWEYYDAGPRGSSGTVVLLPPLSGTADCFFLQSLALSNKGYRVVSCTPSGSYRSILEWAKGMNRFLEAVKVAECHLVGAGLGSFLALSFAQVKPKRVLSLVMVNGFVDNQHFIQKNTFFGAFSMVPNFMLQKAVLSSFPRGPLELRMVRSVDFMVEQVSRRLGSRDLSSRLTLLTAPSVLDAQEISLEDRCITVIEALDDQSRPESTKLEVMKFFPGAQQAHLKSGGEFPYLSRSSDFNMHLQVHLRKHSDVENRSGLFDTPPQILPFELPEESASTSMS